MKKLRCYGWVFLCLVVNPMTKADGIRNAAPNVFDDEAKNADLSTQAPFVLCTETNSGSVLITLGSDHWQAVIKDSAIGLEGPNPEFSGLIKWESADLGTRAYSGTGFTLTLGVNSHQNILDADYLGNSIHWDKLHCTIADLASYPGVTVTN